MSKTANHTPGPWEISPLYLANGMVANDGSLAVMQSGPDGVRIGTVDLQSPVKRGEAYKSVCPVRDANARLIAAAPDLRSAVELLLDECGYSWVAEKNLGMAEYLRRCAVIETAKSALASATGAA